MHRLWRALLCGVLTSLAAMVPARAQDWPTRPVTLVSLFSTGGTGDVVMRAIAKALGDTFGQQFVIDYRLGAGGAVGSASVARAPPDGYTFMMTATGPAVLNRMLLKSVPYNTDTDFTPVIVLGDIPQLIVSSPQLGFKQLPDLVDFGKRNPGTLNVGHAGAGSMGHLAAALFLARSGIQGTLIGYRGAAPVVADVLSGQMHAGFPIVIPAAASVTTLAVTSDQRLGFLPDVPTAREAGTDLLAGTWFAIMAPAGVPKPIVMQVNQTIDRFLKSEGGAQQLARLGMRALGGPPERLTQVIENDRRTWGPVIANENFLLDSN